MSIRKNTLINLVGAIVPMGVMLVTVPLYLSLLGEARYGVLALVWLVLGYFSFMEMGLGKATANQIAKAQEAPARERAEIFWTALTVNAGMGVVAAGILWLVGDYLISHVLKMPDDFRAEALAALPWMVITFPLALVSSVLNGVLEGRNQFAVLNALQMFGNVVFQIAPLVAAYWISPSLATVIPTAIISRLAMNLPLLAACRILVFRGGGFVISTTRIRSLLSFGGWVAVTGIVGPVLETVDRLLVGALLGAKAVTYYVIPYQLAGKLRVVPGSLARALFPKFSVQTADDELSMTALKGLVAIMTPAVIVAIFLLPPFMKIWVGADLATTAAPVGQLFLLGIWANSLAYVPMALLQGSGRPSVVAKLHLIEIVPFISVLYVATINFGLMGAAFAWALRVVIDAILMFWLARQGARAWQAAGLSGFLVIIALALALLTTQKIVISAGAVALLIVSLWIGRHDLARLIMPIAHLHAKGSHPYDPEPNFRSATSRLH